MSPKVAPEKIWYLEIKGKKSGPYTYEHINEKIIKKEIDYEDLVYKEGMDDWVQIGALPQFGKRKSAPDSKIKEIKNVKIPDGKVYENKDKIWYICNPDSNFQKGPLSLQEALDLLKSGEFTFQDYVWTQEFGEEWKMIKEVKEFDRRVRSNMPKMPSLNNFLNDPQKDEASISSLDELDIKNGSVESSNDIYNIDNEDQFEPLELTKAGDSDILDNDRKEDFVYNNEGPQMQTKTSAVNKYDNKRADDYLNTEQNLGKEVNSTSYSRADEKSFTEPEIPEDINDSGLQSNEEDNNDDNYKSTYSSDAFTESIEGETSCSLVDIDASNTSINGITSSRKKKIIKKRSRLKFLKKIGFLILIFSTVAWAYYNFHPEIKKILISVLPKEASDFIFRSETKEIVRPIKKPDKTFKETPKKTKVKTKKDKISHYKALEKISLPNQKDQYVLKIVGSDTDLKKQSSIEVIKASKQYKTNNHDIIFLQLQLPDVKYSELKNKSAFFRKLIKEKKIKLNKIDLSHLSTKLAELHIQHNKKPIAISWYRIAARSSNKPDIKAGFYEKIGDLYFEEQKHKYALKNYKVSFKYFKRNEVKQKIQKVNGLYKKESSKKKL